MFVDKAVVFPPFDPSAQANLRRAGQRGEPQSTHFLDLNS